MDHAWATACSQHTVILIISIWRGHLGRIIFYRQDFPAYNQNHQVLRKGDKLQTSTSLSPDFLIFDMDGVLIDATQSYPEAIAEAIWRYLDLHHLGSLAFSPDDSALFKQAGGFNDEWDLTYAAALWATWRTMDTDSTALSIEEFTNQVRQAGGGITSAQHVIQQNAPSLWESINRTCSQSQCEQLAQECYGGSDACQRLFGFTPQYRIGPGWHRIETALVPASLLARWRGRLAIYTGRNREEADFALEMAGLSPLFPSSLRITTTDRCLKPDPEGIARIYHQHPFERAWYFGDTIDDCRTVKAYRQKHTNEGHVQFVGILEGAMGAQSHEIFSRCQADMTAPLARQVLETIKAPGQ